MFFHISNPTKILQHYGRSDIRTKLDTALKACGLHETIFLFTPSGIRAALEQAGFEVVTWDDRTIAVPLLGLHVVMGSDFPALTANSGRDLREAESASCRPFCSVDR